MECVRSSVQRVCPCLIKNDTAATTNKKKKYSKCTIKDGVLWTVSSIVMVLLVIFTPFYLSAFSVPLAFVVTCVISMGDCSKTKTGKKPETENPPGLPPSADDDSESSPYKIAYERASKKGRQKLIRQAKKAARKQAKIDLKKDAKRQEDLKAQQEMQAALQKRRAEIARQMELQKKLAEARVADGD